jgi:hypothetical protein
VLTVEDALGVAYAFCSSQGIPNGLPETIDGVWQDLDAQHGPHEVLRLTLCIAQEVCDGQQKGDAIVALAAILTLIAVAVGAVVQGSIGLGCAFSGAMREVPVTLFLQSFGLFVRRADPPGVAYVPILPAAALIRTGGSCGAADFPR